MGERPAMKIHKSCGHIAGRYQQDWKKVGEKECPLHLPPLDLVTAPKDANDAIRIWNISITKIKHV